MKNDTREPIAWYKQDPIKETIYDAQCKVVNAGLNVMTKDFAFSILREAGIKQTSDRAYSLAKKCLVGGHVIDSAVYDRMIGYIQEYIGEDDL